jgi:hypothetical protein
MTDSVLEEFLRESREYTGETPSDSLRKVTRAFFQRANSDPAILRAAAEALPALSPAAAGWIALVLGSAVESGKDPAVTMPALLQLLRSWFARLPPVSEEESLPEPTPEQQALIEALRPVCQSVVAHLARMPAERQRLVEDLELLERLADLENYSHGPGWVREALLRSSGTLIVLHPPSGVGFKLRYENVATNFHLMSLVQTAIGTRIPGGREPDPKIAAAARGQTNDDVDDEAWWHYGDPRSKTPELRKSIWGEGLVTEIPMINGARVMLLWPPILESRGWGRGFFGPHLQASPADVVVEEELSPEGRRAWFEALGMSTG